MIKKTLYIAVFLIFWANSFAQVDTSGQGELEFQIESLAEDNEENETDLIQIADNYELYRSNPINLNTATQKELEALQLLTIFQINNLLEYRRRMGKIVSIYELRVIPEFDDYTIQKILPFITVSLVERRKLKPKYIWKYGRHDLITRYQRQIELPVGYDPSDDPDANRYLGSPERIFTRYQYSYGKQFRMGFTAEKDPGEQFLKGAQKYGFDYYSAHIYMSDIGKFKSIALGDYAVEFGQGLSLWSGFAFGKSADVLGNERFARGIRPYSGANENRFMRGAAVQYELARNLELTAFYSRNRVDANISQPDTIDDEVAEVSSLQISGLHRTPSEIKDRKSLGLEMYGGHLGYKWRFFEVGFLAYQTNMDATLNRRADAENQYRFSGDENFNMAVDYRIVWKKINFFGETARSTNGWATTNGLLVNPHEQVNFVIQARNIQKDFFAVYNAPFAESQTPGEKGYYFAMDFAPIPRVSTKLYYDLYEFEWYRFQTDGPSNGEETGIQVEYNPNSRLNMYGRFRWERRDINQSTNGNTRPLIDQIRRTLRFHISFRASDEWTFKTRIENSRFQKEDIEYGWLFYQDINYTFQKAPLKLYSRFALFNTDGFNARIYAYENDVLYSFSIPGYFYRGSRYYIMLKYDLGNRVDLWLRYAQSYFSDRQILGSGLNEYVGQTRSEIKAQIRIKF
jgi:hypothetical protein